MAKWYQAMMAKNKILVIVSLVAIMISAIVIVNEISKPKHKEDNYRQVAVVDFEETKKNSAELQRLGNYLIIMRNGFEIRDRDLWRHTSGYDKQIREIDSYLNDNLCKWKEECDIVEQIIKAKEYKIHAQASDEGWSQSRMNNELYMNALLITEVRKAYVDGKRDIEIFAESVKGKARDRQMEMDRTR